MGMFEGKVGIVMGVANNHSIAWAVSEELAKEGAQMGFSHLPDTNERKRNEKRVRTITESLEPRLIAPCDVQSDEDIVRFFEEVKEVYGKIDFLVHSIAFAPIDDLKCDTIDCSREGFKTAMDISCYSLIAVAREAAKLMNDGGSIIAMTYFGGEKVVKGYNMMGICKAALDSTVKYLASDLGEKNIRVNAVSAGPLRTLASSAVGEFAKMMKLYQSASPLGRNLEAKEVGQSSVFLLSHMSSAITGEILHVDCGYNIMGSPSPDE